MSTTHYRACHLCEAMCGLAIEVEGNTIKAIKGDPEDTFSQGYICPKAVALQDIHEDPDRLRHPVKKVDNQWQAITWEEAYELFAEGLASTLDKHGGSAVAAYLGNPTVHNWGLMTHRASLLGLIKGKKNFSATSVDQLPHQLCSLLMFGHQLLIPIPDIDHTQLFMIFGGNPMASNGSIMTVPNFRGRVKNLKQRGGELIVFDPRRSETAEVATAHHFVRPGTDALVLMAMLRVIFEEGLERTEAYQELLLDLDAAKAAVQPFTLELVAAKTGVSAEVISDNARKLATTERAAIYGRMGVSTQRFGTLAQWAIYTLNIVCGNLDKVGGVLFTKPAMDTAGPGSNPGAFNRFQTRVSQLPEFGGEYPVATLAEEILTPGEGQIKALITSAGNPVLSTPNGQQLSEALDALDFMAAIDFYINETTAKADLILPPTSPLEHDHYDIVFNAFAVRNVTRYNPALFDKPEGSKHDWEILHELGQALAKKIGAAEPAKMQPTDLLNFALSMGPYGNKSEHPIAPLNLEKLKQYPHGIDLGPLSPSLPQRLANDGKIHCFPSVIADHLPDLVATLQTPEDDALLLIGRRHIRSNNSWMHNSRRLMKGKGRHQLLMHPQDLSERNIADGSEVEISSRVGTVKIEVCSSEDIMPGVVSLPHGFGHQQPGVKLTVAREYPGVSANDLTDEKYLDTVSGNAALNGVRVSVRAVS